MQFSRMETLPLDARAMLGFERRFVSAVNTVAQQGMSDGCHMHADLMRSSRLQSATKQGENISVRMSFGKCFPMGDCRSAFEISVANHRHPFAVCGVSANGRVHRSRMLSKTSDGDRIVHAAHQVLLDVRRKL